MGRNSVAVPAAVAGAAAAIVERNRREDRANRNNRDDIRDLEKDVRDLETSVFRIGNLGALIRGTATQVADFLNGIALPATQAPPTPSTFPNPTGGLTRPIFDEEAAVDSAYPPEVNAYNDQGKLINPATPFGGQLLKLGTMFGFAELLAVVTGLTQQTGTSPPGWLKRQYYRIFQALSQVLAEQATAPLSLDAYKQAWRRFLVAVGPAPLATLQVISQILGPTTTWSGATAETVLAVVPMPGNTITVRGQRALLDIASPILNINGSDTMRFRLRLDSLTGTLLYDTGAVNALLGTNAILAAQMMCLATGTSGQLALGGDTFLKGVAGDPQITTELLNLDLTAPHTFVWTVALSSTNAANQTAVNYAQLDLERTS